MDGYNSLNRLMIMAEEHKIISGKATLLPAYIPKSEVPKGAIKLTEAEVLKMQYKRLERAKPSERISFRFAPHLTGGSTALTACLVNAYFRHKFLLFDYNMMFSYGPTVIVPTCLCLIANAYLTNKVLLQRECTGCLEVRSGILQVATAVFYSSIIAPLTSIVLARKYHTYSPQSNFQPDMKLMLKTTPFHRACFLGLIFHNFVVGACIRYKQKQELDRIVAKEPTLNTAELLETLYD